MQTRNSGRQIVDERECVYFDELLKGRLGSNCNRGGMRRWIDERMVDVDPDLPSARLQNQWHLYVSDSNSLLDSNAANLEVITKPAKRGAPLVG